MLPPVDVLSIFVARKEATAEEVPAAILTYEEDLVERPIERAKVRVRAHLLIPSNDLLGRQDDGSAEFVVDAIALA